MANGFVLDIGALRVILNELLPSGTILVSRDVYESLRSHNDGLDIRSDQAPGSTSPGSGSGDGAEDSPVENKGSSESARSGREEGEVRGGTEGVREEVRPKEDWCRCETPRTVRMPTHTLDSPNVTWEPWCAICLRRIPNMMDVVAERSDRKWTGDGL